MDPSRPGGDGTFAPATTAVAEPGDINPGDEPADRQDVIFERLMGWEAAYLRGDDPAPEEVCHDAPSLVQEVGKWIAQRKKLYELMGLREPADRVAADGDPLPVFPGHEILREIGRGGMGVVYLARDQRLGRIVAIKTIAGARLATPGQVDRFLLEARAVARLRHPYIVAIHAIGEDPKRPFLSLEFVDGGNLAERLAERPMPPLEAALLLELLAQAVHAVHEQGIVHRDLKPSNVLLTAAGVPKIGDFGVAKLMDDQAAHTLTEQVLGTPSFMAPEQALGHSKQAGPAADVYALEAIL